MTTTAVSIYRELVVSGGQYGTRSTRSEPFDLDSLSDEELQALRERVNAMLDERVRNRFAEYQRIARGVGYEVTLTKIGEEPRRRRGRMSGRENRRSEIVPKYRNPESPSETWSGRGREPKWLQHQIAAGKSKEDFLIDRQESRQPAA